MAITRIGSASAATTTVTVPAHAIGDLIVIFAFRDGTATAPTLGSGFTNITTKTATSTAMRIGFRIATSTSDASGTWTNASSLLCVVYRPTSGNTIGVGANATASGTANTGVSIPALTMQDTSGASAVLACMGHRSVDQSLATKTVTGLTEFLDLTNATCEVTAWDGIGLSSFSSSSMTLTGTASGWTSCAIEILDTPPPSGDAWDPTKSTGMVLTNSGKTATGASTAWSVTTTTTSAVKMYVELVLGTISTSTFIGFSNSGGTDLLYWSSNGTLNGDIGGTIETYNTGDTIAMAIDTSGKVWFKNLTTGSNWNNSGTADPATGTGGQPFASGINWFVQFVGAASGQSATIVTGDAGFTGTIPSGFVAWYAPGGTTVSLLALSFSMSLAPSAIQGSTTLSGVGMAASFMRAIAGLATPLLGSSKSSSSSKATLIGKAALASRSAAVSSGRSSLVGKLFLSARSAGTSIGKGAVGFFAFLTGRAASQSTAASGTPRGAAALLGTIKSMSQARAAIAGKASLLSKATAQSKASAGAVFRASLAGFSASKSRAGGQLAAFLGLSGSTTSRSSSRVALTAIANLFAQARASSSSRTTNPTGVLALLARSMAASFAKIVPPGGLALLARSMGAAFARAGISGRTALAGSSVARSSAKGAGKVALALQAASRALSRASAGLLVRTGLAAASRAVSSSRIAGSFRARMAATSRATSRAAATPVGKIFLAGASKATSFSRGVVGGILQDIFLTGGSFAASSLRALLQVFGPSIRRAAAFQNRSAKVPPPAANTLTIVPTQNRSASANQDRTAQVSPPTSPD